MLLPKRLTHFGRKSPFCHNRVFTQTQAPSLLDYSSGNCLPCLFGMRYGSIKVLSWYMQSVLFLFFKIYFLLKTMLSSIIMYVNVLLFVIVHGTKTRSVTLSINICSLIVLCIPLKYVCTVHTKSILSLHNVCAYIRWSKSLVGKCGLVLYFIVFVRVVFHSICACKLCMVRVMGTNHGKCLFLQT